MKSLLETGQRVLLMNLYYISEGNAWIYPKQYSLKPRRGFGKKVK
jgi:hypothetical protein